MSRKRTNNGNGKKENSPETEELWIRYKEDGSTESRNRIAEHYMPIVKYNADRIHVKLPGEVEKDDLISAGFFGLLDAIEAFDLDRGVKFETYCAPRIRGAILDELRAIDWVPRIDRAKKNRLENVKRALEAILKRAPDEAEIADYLHIPLSEEIKYDRVVEQWPFPHVVNHESGELEQFDRDAPECRNEPNPLNEAYRKDLKELVTKGLTRAERLILVMYYYEEMTMREIGVTLDLSESRVSQMHASLLDRFRSYLGYERGMKEDDFLVGEGGRF